MYEVQKLENSLLVRSVHGEIGMEAYECMTDMAVMS